MRQIKNIKIFRNRDKPFEGTDTYHLEVDFTEGKEPHCGISFILDHINDNLALAAMFRHMVIFLEQQ